MNQSIIKWLKRMFLFISPFIIILLIYIILDPFKVTRKYQSFYVSDEPNAVGLNRDYVSTCTFDNYYLSNQYDSFIFGNSRSMFYEVQDWLPHIDANSKCFHFDASGESLYGMYRKVKYIDKHNVPIKNVLFVLDYFTLLKDERPDTDFFITISPQLEDNKNIFKFHLNCFRAFLSPNFLIAYYYNYKIFGKIDTQILDDRPAHYDLNTNELSFPYFEQLIEKGEFYTPKRMNAFYTRDSINQSFSPVAIEEPQKQMLMEIHAIFQKHKTDCKIIISPLYNQKKLNEQDIIYLKSLFGEKNVFDFSGINEFTNDFHNYYEDAHYRPHVTRELLNRIYQ